MSAGVDSLGRVARQRAEQLLEVPAEEGGIDGLEDVAISPLVGGRDHRREAGIDGHDDHLEVGEPRINRAVCRHLRHRARVIAGRRRSAKATPVLT